MDFGGKISGKKSMQVEQVTAEDLRKDAFQQMHNRIQDKPSCEYKPLTIKMRASSANFGQSDDQESK